MKASNRPEDRVCDVFTKLLKYCEHQDFRGWDPFDGLNSPFIAATPLRKSRFARLAWLQIFKRLPVNFRRPTLVPKTPNAVTASVAARVYTLLKDEKNALDQLEILIKLRSPKEKWGNGAWGYPFAWQARAFYVPKGVPNVISTAFACRAMIEAKHRVELIVSAGRFIEEYLFHRLQNGKCFVRYVPDSDTMVHNANLWGAYVLILAGRISGRKAFVEMGQAAIEYSIERQLPDGSWQYGEAPHHQFVDGFHTGYNLEAIHESSSYSGAKDVKNVLLSGLDFYKRELFTNSGVAKYYASGIYPIDCNSISQGIITLVRVHPSPESYALAEKLVHWAVENMWLNGKNHFAYQMRSWGLITIPYMRWSQIWMLYALALWRHDNRRKMNSLN